jgi:hypothetical protein
LSSRDLSFGRTEGDNISEEGSCTSYALEKRDESRDAGFFSIEDSIDAKVIERTDRRALNRKQRELSCVGG